MVGLLTPAVAQALIDDRLREAQTLARPVARPADRAAADRARHLRQNLLVRMSVLAIDDDAAAGTRRRN
jgi:hypothetical protein